MNTKRQTIWLVSMLSLMVVLSAYYLFTEDVNKLNKAADKATQEDIKVTTQVKDPAAGTADKETSGKIADAAVSKDASASAEDGAAKDDASKDDAAVADAGTADAAMSDAEVIKKIQTAGASGEDFFAAQYMKRNDELAKESQKYLNMVSNTKLSDVEIAKADEELNKIQTTQAKVENIEDLLAKDYKNAIVLQEGNKYKVVVQAEKLDRKQAQTIIDLVIKELNVSKDYISVQYMH